MIKFEKDKSWFAQYFLSFYFFVVVGSLNIPQEEQPSFRKSVDISKGYMTLEWVLPSPPPEHTFEELPIIKEYALDQPVEPSFEQRFSKILFAIERAKSVSDEQKQAFKALSADFKLADRELAILSELMERYAKGDAPGFPNEYHDAHHDDDHHH